MNYKQLFFISICFITTSLSFGQKDWSKIIKDNIKPKAFAEAYYGVDMLNTESKSRPDFIYNYKNLKEVGLNSAIFGFDFDYRRTRTSISFIGGNYATYNLSGEPQGLNHIYEANFGFKLLKYHDLWLDVGVMESNLGFESVVSSTNRSMSRSLLAEGSPYYLNAAKLGYTSFNEKWEIEALLSNGWQKMTNGTPSFGHTIKFHPNEKWTINSSSFMGQVFIGITNPIAYKRFFHNFYIQRESEKTSLTVGVDWGMDRRKPTLPPLTWEAYIAEFSYSFNNKISASLRGEYFFDPESRASSFNSYSPIEMVSATAGVSIQLHELIKLRFETRYMKNFGTYNFFPSPYPINNEQEEFLFFGSSISVDLWNH